MINRRIELIFPAELKDEAIICNLCKKFDIVVNILEASFSTETGWAILILKGREAQLNNAMNFLREHGVKIEDNQAA